MTRLYLTWRSNRLKMITIIYSRFVIIDNSKGKEKHWLGLERKKEKSSSGRFWALKKLKLTQKTVEVVVVEFLEWCSSFSVLLNVGKFINSPLSLYQNIVEKYYPCSYQYSSKREHHRIIFQIQKYPHCQQVFWAINGKRNVHMPQDIHVSRNTGIHVNCCWMLMLTTIIRIPLWIFDLIDHSRDFWTFMWLWGSINHESSEVSQSVKLNGMKVLVSRT